MNIVIYTQRVEIVESYGERRDCADQNIARFIETCGYAPLPIPNVISDLKRYVQTLKPKGILLTGGNSLVEYGGNAPERDNTDKCLLDIALELHIPVYGFCRGMQSILCYFDCILCQVKGHVATRHTIVDNNGVVCGVVNSYHNQACMVQQVKKPLVVVAQSEDGIAECIRHQELPIVATMWHPERESEFQKTDIDRVRSLFG